jgi:hypothetical protein
MFSGWPDNIRDISGSGPVGPIFAGVWQSWHPAVSTMYLPRSMGEGVGAGGGGGGGAGVAHAAMRTEPHTNPANRALYLMSTSGDIESFRNAITVIGVFEVTA